MNTKFVAILDDEIGYACHLMEYLKTKDLLPLEVHVFSDADKLLRGDVIARTALLVVAESEYSAKVAEAGFMNLLILNESDRYLGEEPENVSKYQSMELISKAVRRKVTELLREEGEGLLPAVRHTGALQIIGVYTPVRRCLQTTFSLTLGQLLSRRAKVLYLNFENFSGLEYMLNRDFRGSVSDLLYYNECAREKLAAQLAMMVEDLNGMHFIPPMKSFIELRAIQAQQWIGLFKSIEKVTDYDYLILDLTEATDGLFSILRDCTAIYTLTRPDGFSAAKIKEYELTLKNMHFEDLCTKTRRWQLPVFRELPSRLENLTHGELAEYIRGLLENGDYALP
ncbi:MAG: hypothetical protein Q4C60_09250 [Eubacteriales bacterium]|nr:hypothetical protein [Eubacteriales bacterium]